MTQQTDDPTVLDDCRLFRRIPLQPSHIIWNDNRKEWSISSAAFRNARESIALSVDLEDTMLRLGLTIDHVVRDRDRYAVASLSARFVRQHQQGVVRVPEEGNPTHGHIVGEKPKSVQEAFKGAAEWVVFPGSWPR